MDFIDNNSAHGLGEALRDVLDANSRMSIIASYFTIFGYKKLRDRLQGIQDFRFIFDEPTFIKQMNREKEPREFVLSQRAREHGIGGVGLELTLRNGLDQRASADECADWIARKAKFKTSKAAGNLQTGSMFLVSNGSSEATHAFTGQNIGFTMEGLGYEHNPNVFAPITHFAGSPNEIPQTSIFNMLWDNDSMLQDVTEEVLQQVRTLYRENSPEFIYFLTLYNIFRDRVEDEGDIDTKHTAEIQDTAVWSRLYDFQKDAVVGAIRKLERYKGCIIADSVGLGKTFEALAVIKYYQELNDRVLVLTPKRLRENWTMYLGNDERNILVDDRFSYDVLNHTDLSRRHGKSGDINLETLRWDNYGLVVIDESHNFRNRPTDTTTDSRYYRLLNDVIKKGRRTKVLMLSATPVNNRLLDLRNQLDIITEDDDTYLRDDGIPSINTVTRTAQQRFKEWSELPDAERTTQSFVESLNGDYFKLLDIFTIARGRKHIAKYYTGQGGDQFPERLKPISLHTTIDAEGQLPSIKELNNLIAQLAFPQYQLLQYVTDPVRRRKYQELFGDTWGTNMEAQTNRTQAIAGLMRVNLLKRLESSVHSFNLSIERILENARKLMDDLNALDAGRPPVNYAPVIPQDIVSEDDADELPATDKVTVDIRDVDRLKLRAELNEDITILQKLHNYVQAITPERDQKLIKLADLIRTKIEQTPYNPENRKILIFSAFADTAKYLYTSLADGLKHDFSINSALITGAGGTQSTLKLTRTTFDNALAHFSPKSKELPKSDPVQDEIDIVFATDCISEGQNLQDCDCLINYDIHWNPVRIIQRFGRIDRLGSTNTQIQLINFWPDIELDEYIQLEGRVRSRMTMLDVSASGDENVLEGKRNSEMNDLQYRKRQLQQLQQEVLDLEDISGNISITDFALDDFKVELNRYMQQHGTQLENAPMGIHTVAKIPEALRDEIEPGVIFCLKYKGSVERTTSNPIAPYAIMLVNAQGEVKTTPAYPKMALDYMRGVCAGEHEPIEQLYRQFNRDTRDGRDMRACTKLLEAAVSTLNGTHERNAIDDLFSLGEVNVESSERGFDDYTLVTFAVLK